jgi:hypothetical protein
MNTRKTARRPKAGQRNAQRGDSHVGSGDVVGHTGAELIAAERLRQIVEEKWSARHDAEHRRGELSKAAVHYANVASTQAAFGITGNFLVPGNWPWDAKWWKPSKDPVRNLVKAGALIAAEIDRLLAAGKTRRPNDPGQPRET